VDRRGVVISRDEMGEGVFDLEIPVNYRLAPRIHSVGVNGFRRYAPVVFPERWSFTGHCLIGIGRLISTPSPGPPRLMKAPDAVHPLPQGGEGWFQIASSLTPLEKMGWCQITSSLTPLEKMGWFQIASPLAPLGERGRG
jgi:hypothetical protein